MHLKDGLGVLAAVFMGFLAVVPIAYPEAAGLLWWRIAALVVFILGIAALYLQARLAKREDQKRQLEQAKRDADSGKRFDELVELFRQLQQPATIAPAPSATPTLKQRTQQVAEELFRFLKEKGPEAPAPSLKANDAEYRRMFDVYFDYVHKMYFGYMAHFREHVVRIDHELAEHGIMTGLTLREIDPPQDTREVNVRKIAESLLLAAAKMN